MRRIRIAVGLAAALSLATAGSAAAQEPACPPFGGPVTLRGEVPTAKSVIGIDLGERDVTSVESDRYVAAVDRASRRVISGQLATSVEGRPLRYAIVGQPGRLTNRALARIRDDADELRDPDTSPRRAAAIANRTPAILWIAGNVHGGEESGTDAALRTLYELADRTDCTARQVLRESIVVILPTQNPDGREADTRRNAYGFDMNRDWFARTQPETDGKVEFLRDYPPQLFIDAHEMGRATYFLPPNADPIYHELTDESVDWINNLYGAPISAELARQGIPFFNRDVYDLFYMGYGDTVPSTGFIAAGMTFEKASGDPTARRTYEQYVTQWTALSQATRDKDAMLRRWHGAWVEAQRQGEAGELEPNEIVNPGNEVVTQVPDRPVRHYFIRDENPAKRREVRALVRRLLRMDVRVRRLVAPLSVPDYTPYGRPARAATVPAGSYWVTLAQPMKHWVQAMLNEDTYTPFPYFYDVTAWSQPLLFNVAGGYSGAELRPAGGGEPVYSMADPGQPAAPADTPAVGVFQISATAASSIESAGWLRYLLDRWNLRHRVLGGADVAGALGELDVLLVPNGDAAAALTALGEPGQAALAEWVSGGGRLVAWRGGATLVARLGLTQAQVSEPSAALGIPGSLLRVAVDEGSPLAAGVGPFAWALWENDDVLRHPDPARVPVAFPAAGSEDFFVSGFAQGEEELGGTAAVVDEPVGEGRTVLFSFDPNYRAFTDGTQRILRNAILGDAPAPARATSAAVRARAAATRRAQRAATRVSTLQSPLHLVVRTGGEAAARRVLAGHDAAFEARRGAGRVAFTIANPGERTGDEHPYARELPGELRRAGVPVVSFSAP